MGERYPEYRVACSKDTVFGMRVIKMANVVDYVYDENIISRVTDWNYGTNWPVVYIYYNSVKAYVGETLDAVRRTEQHKSEKQFDEFTNLCFITNKTFNKSVILDLESFLIKYISADGTKKLLNGNAGVVDHNYFYKEAYEDDFKEIWQILIEKGIVSKSLVDIENSELFKYSPYKTLNQEQQKTAYEILYRIYEINNATDKTIIQVTGGAGTGKTILAVYIVKLLEDILSQKKIWKSIEDKKEADMIEGLSKRISGIKEIGFVVPMNELRNTMKRIFASVDGLSPKMIYAPEEVVKKYFDILVVDEAHRLYQNKHLPQGATSKFKKINMQLMGDSYTNTDADLTELDWIIKSSRIQVLFYDSKQAIRTPDISADRFKRICAPHLYRYVELFSQMRCKGGNGYYEYVRRIITHPGMTQHDYKTINNYTLKIVDSINDLIKLIDYQNTEGDGLCKLTAGPAWTMNEDIVIEDRTFHWVGSGLDNDIIYSIHKIQGFDLNYAGVIFGREVYYDTEKKRIEINKKNLKDNHTKSSGNEMMRDFVLDIYLTLMTRGIHGTYVYAMDDRLRAYLKDFLT